MKTPILKPGFEFVFAFSLLAILGLPPMLMAQNQKDVEIKIENGDTTVNGKNIKDLSATDRKNAFRDIRHLSADELNNSAGNNRVYLFRRKDSVSEHAPMITRSIIIQKDSLGNIVQMRSGRRMNRDGAIIRRPPMDGSPDRMAWMDRNSSDPMRGPLMGFARRNSQTFNYINTDSNDISTRISFHISDVTNDDLKRMPHVEGPRLDISDLNVVPEFSSGKTLLLFNLPSKAIAEVKLVDSEGKILWTQKTSGGSFSKTFVMGLNGIYYLQVKQGSGVAVKRILKEE